MKMRALVAEHIERHDLCPGAESIDAWLRGHWIRFRVGRRTLPVLPLWGLKSAHVAHDVHHVLLGYPTTLRGECAIAGWELASGGCAWNLFFWVDRLLVVGLGMLCHPRATWAGWRRGRGARNLYGMPIDDILDADVSRWRRRIAGSSQQVG